MSKESKKRTQTPPRGGMEPQVLATPPLANGFPSVSAMLPAEKTHQPVKKPKKELREPREAVEVAETANAPTPSRNAPEAAHAPTPARSELPRSQSQPIESTSKRPRRNASPAPVQPPTSVAPSSPKRQRENRENRDHRENREHRGRSERESRGIAWVLSTIRSELESMSDVDGVRQQLEEFPECVLLGGIAARRELVSSLLGEHAHANNAAAALVAPGMRQPVALELRCAPNGGLDLSSAKGPEADAWLASVTQAASAALGNRLKVDPLRLRLSAVGCANLDVVDLPERGGQGTVAIPPKVEEMHIRFLGSSTNLLVCLEPGLPLDLARRFDPTLQRTVLLGAAAVATGSAHGITTALPPSMLCGPSAAKALEDRFMKMCVDRAPKWISSLEQLETRFSKSTKEAQEAAQNESTIELLSRARAAGLSFGRALQQVVAGTPCCTAGALTLEEEILDFAHAASQSACGIGGCLSGQEAAEAVEEVFSNFNGVEGYIAYLRENVGISNADVPLNGGSAWYRLMEEIEVAMRLVHPSAQDLQELSLCAIQAGGTGIHGHQRWDDVAAKLLLEIAFEPLHRRIRYVAARVGWALKQQKSAIAEWMAAVEDGPASRLYSPLFAQHLQVLRSSPIIRELVFTAFDKAAVNVTDTLLKNLEGTLSAMCLNPKMMLRPQTLPDDDISKLKNRSKETVRDRVKGEMRKRNSGSSGGLPPALRDRTFDPGDAKQEVPQVERELCRAFKVLAVILANQAFAFADTTLAALCSRHVDEAMNSIQFSPEQERALAAREAELQNTVTQARNRWEKTRRCLNSLRSARS